MNYQCRAFYFMILHLLFICTVEAYPEFLLNNFENFNTYDYR
jgi:hypothetical protein